MNYLGIDTSGNNLTVIVRKGKEYFTYFDNDCGVNHSVALMPKVEEMLNEADLTLKDLNFIASVVGAGSFTGIRIGVSTVKALCFANKLPFVSITSFDTLSYNKQGKVLAVIDAKHNGYYVCGYNQNKVILEPEYVSGEKLNEISKEYPVKLSNTEIDIKGFETVSVLNGFINAVENKKDETSFDYDNLTPLYVRKSQAEEGR